MQVTLYRLFHIEVKINYDVIFPDNSGVGRVGRMGKGGMFRCWRRVAISLACLRRKFTPNALWDRRKPSLGAALSHVF